MRVGNERVEPGIATGTCAFCNAEFYHWHPRHRFCSPRCNYEFHQQERRNAIALYREMTRGYASEEKKSANG
jgi:hypothetical protein